MANGNVYGREPATGRAAAALPQIRILCAACRKHVYRRGKNLEFSDTEEQKMAARKSVLLFWSLDRLCREGTVETLNHLQRLTSYGVNYRSFTEQYLDSTGHLRGGGHRHPCGSGQAGTRAHQRARGGRAGAGTGTGAHRWPSQGGGRSQAGGQDQALAQGRRVSAHHRGQG